MISLILAGLLAAQAAPPAASEADRPVTRAQLEAINRAKFEQMDRDRDGFLTGAELSALSGADKAASTLAALDSNRDSKVTLAELSSRMLAVFDLTDANRDGIVTPEERASMRAAVKGRR